MLNFMYQHVTLSTKDHVKLTKQLSERSLYCNKYKVIPNKQLAAKEQIRESLDANYQGVQRLLFWHITMLQTM